MIVYDTHLFYIDGGQLLVVKNRHDYPYVSSIYKNADFKVMGIKQRWHRYDSLSMVPIEFDGVCVFNPNEDRTSIDVLYIGYWKDENGPLKGMELVEKFCADSGIDINLWQWAEL